MFVKSDIRKVSIAAEKVFYSEIFQELGMAGILHFFRSAGNDSLTDAAFAPEEAKTKEIVSDIEYVFGVLDIQPEGAMVEEGRGDIDRDAAFAKETRMRVEGLQALEERIEDALAGVETRFHYKAILDRMGIDPESLKKARLIKAVFGTLEKSDSWETPPRKEFEIIKSGKYICGVALPETFPSMVRNLNEYGFVDRSEEIVHTSFDMLEVRRRTLDGRRNIVHSALNELKKTESGQLVRLYGRYRQYEKILNALKMSLFSSRAVFITGWMDIRDTEKLFEILRRICGSRFIASISEERDPHAPVRLANTRFVKPFELLVKTMGMPAADELDPTPLAAVTFVLMFGLMFGDLGQGIVLALAGAVLYRIAERKKGSRSTLGQSGAILIVCGLSAALCGILYGSIFSNENIIPALLFHPMSHIMNLFFLTILIGAFIIAAGLMVNIINCLLNSNYSEAFLEKRGLAVLILYGAAVLYFVRYAETGKGMPAWYGILFFLFPLALFAFRGLLGPVLFHSRWPHNWVDYVIETCVEILEIGLSMLANTVSFIRVGAFALSHAGLSIVTYTLAGIADPSLTSPGAIAIIIAGNIFIIGFEALICGIQSMRLEYYEFFSKFFKGDGVVFSPFTLKPQASEV